MTTYRSTSTACARGVSWSMLLLQSLVYFYLNLAHGMTVNEIRSLRQETRDLFYHGYANYMQHAFPEDELRPISCRPQTRNRADPADIGLNDVLGNYSLTLIDSLSTLAILASGEGGEDSHNSFQDFKDGVEALVGLYGSGDKEQRCGSRACGFELDSKVQVFETNIRGVGGLLSAHLFAVGDLPIRGYQPRWETTSEGTAYIAWDDFKYDGQLLRLAHDLASRLLPAFDTPTGLPYPRVNLKHGAAFYLGDEDGVCHPDGTSTSSGRKESTETCSAGAGSLVLEFSTLSRLTGDSRFEVLAKKAFWAVWERRSGIGLIGNGIDAETGQWIVPSLSGIGAGIDSFYEYAMKSSILLSGLPFEQEDSDIHNPDAFLDIWQKLHAAIKHHVYRSSNAEKHPYYGQADQFSGAPRYAWIDNLSAYYPGLLTLAGELEEAIDCHLTFAALWTRYAALPERWLVPNALIDPNFKHWAGRPEMIESTFYLYQATKDPFYLHTGEMALRDIRRRCWTSCGWADLGDVVTGEQRDRMESFFLGETAKYLYLLFEEDHPLNRLDAPIVFTTEGHPLTIPSRLRRRQVKPSKTRTTMAGADIVAPVCPVPSSPLPMTVSNLVNRESLFHAASLAQLHLVPIQPARASALLEKSETSPGIALADVQSPTNYTYYPWTLPRDLVPMFGFSAAIVAPTTSTLTFPNLDDVPPGQRREPTAQGIHKFLDGVLLSTLSNIRLHMVQESRTLLLPNAEGNLVEMHAGLQYRVQGVANWALGRDEKVILTREAMNGVAAGDPNFSRVKDLEMIDIILDFPKVDIEQQYSDQQQQNDTSTNKIEHGNGEPVPELTLPSIIDSLEAFLVGLINSDDSGPDSPATKLSIAAATPHRTMLPAILPTGAGAAQLPAAVDMSDAAAAALGQLPYTRIYFLDDTLCNVRKLPARVVREHQVLVIKRGDCSFNDKLKKIPSYAPAVEALQIVIVVSLPEARSKGEKEQYDARSGMPQDNAAGASGEKMIRPLLDIKQVTPSGIERRYGIAMVMVDGTPDVVDALRRAAVTTAYYDEGGVLQEQKWASLASGLGVKRRYWFESMGIPIGNLVAL